MNQLVLTIDLEDFSAGLTGHLKANGFMGFGDGWFNISEIVEFCHALNDVANSLTGDVALCAGQSKPDGSEYLERFGIRCYVISKNGVLGFDVSLADPPYSDCRESEISSVRSELKVEIQAAFNFSKDLHKLCLGEIAEVTLVGRG